MHQRGSHVNSAGRVYTLRPESAAGKSAADPLTLLPHRWPYHTTRLRRNLQLNEQNRLTALYGVRGAAAFRANQHATYRIERDLETAEVLLALAQLRDVGPGVDGAPIQALRFLEEGLTVTRWVMDVLTEVWNAGCTPNEGLVRRCLLHYKGKGSDFFAVENYRGLGIGQLLQKLMDLVMTARFEVYINATGCISQWQGGFFPKRGCAEKIFTLSEVVRASIGDSSVALLFVDIRQAHDSCLHPILYQSLLRKGIGGRFLTTLMAMYDGAVAVVEVNCERFGAVPILCGLLQGQFAAVPFFGKETVRGVGDEVQGPYG